MRDESGHRCANRPVYCSRHLGEERPHARGGKVVTQHDQRGIVSCDHGWEPSGQCPEGVCGRFGFQRGVMVASRPQLGFPA